MRTVSFVERLEFETKGNIFSKALKVGDVDNDNGNELVVGNLDGEIQIHKGTDSKPWRKASHLGMITCLDIGDVCNHGINYLVTSCVEGWCHVFAVKPDMPNTEGTETQEENGRLLKPSHRQHLTANSKVILVADIDGDGYKELVIGFSDRQVRSYRWLDLTEDPSAGSLNGRFIPLEIWQLAGQLSTVSVHSPQGGGTDLMVSQPGGAFVTLYGSDETVKANIAMSRDMEEGKELKVVEPAISGPSLVYHPLGTARARNPGVTSEILGNISRRRKGEEGSVPRYCAVCTLDGTLTLVDNDKILWSFYVDHQLFSLAKLDITGDGTEEVIACSTDGHTYIVNRNKDVVRFNFNEEVAAFCAGHYAIGGQNTPCLIYITFNNTIIIYHNICMPRIGSTNLIEVLRDEPETPELLTYFNCDASKPDQMRQLYRWCLYGYPTRPT